MIGQAIEVPRQAADLREPCLDFLARCQDITFSNGVSFGCLQPDDADTPHWLVPYPETTGYLLPTLLAYGQVERAKRAAGWLQQVQQPEGWIPAYLRSIPAAFDTGMVLRGWLAMREALQSDEYDESIERAVEWLSSEDAFESYTRFYGDQPPAYFTRIAWPLIEAGAESETIGRYIGDPDLRPCPDLSHFQVYVARGLWESGLHSDARRWMDERIVQRDDGAVLASPGSEWICMPGVAQAATLWYKMDERERADRALGWLEQHGWPIWASYPKTGEYLPNIAPNWAAKFVLDAYVARDESDKRLERLE